MVFVGDGDEDVGDGDDNHGSVDNDECDDDDDDDGDGGGGGNDGGGDDDDDDDDDHDDDGDKVDKLNICWPHFTHGCLAKQLGQQCVRRQTHQVSQSLIDQE